MAKINQRGYGRAWAIVLALSFQSAAPGEEQRFVFEKAQMGLPFRITLFAQDETVATKAAEAAFERIAVLETILSDYDSDSELSRLSQTSGQGKAVTLSIDLWRVLAPAQQLAERTNGAFDVTVGPLVNVWRRARRKAEMPSRALLAEMRGRVGYKKLRLDPHARTAELIGAEMRLDLGGIAKGYALDEALVALRKHGISRALVSGGGDMVAGEAPPGKPGWRVEVAALDSPDAPSSVTVYLRNRAIATSGDIFQRLEIGGVRYSHIVDPRTGIGLTDHSLVTIIAPDCITADALATAVSVLGPAQGLSLIESAPNSAAHIVRRPGKQIERLTSNRWPAMLGPQP